MYSDMSTNYVCFCYVAPRWLLSRRASTKEPAANTQQKQSRDLFPQSGSTLQLSVGAHGITTVIISFYWYNWILYDTSPLRREKREDEYICIQACRPVPIPMPTRTKVSSDALPLITRSSSHFTAPFSKRMTGSPLPDPAPPFAVLHVHSPCRRN